MQGNRLEQEMSSNSSRRITRERNFYLKELEEDEEEVGINRDVRNLMCQKQAEFQ